MRRVSLFLIFIWTTIVYSQTCEMAKYFDRELSLPIEDFLSLPIYKTLDEKKMNEYLRMDSIRGNISFTSDAFGRFYNDIETSCDTLFAMGNINWHSGNNYYLLRNEHSETLRYELWCVSKTNIPKFHICLYLAYKKRFCDFFWKK